MGSNLEVERDVEVGISCVASSSLLPPSVDVSCSSTISNEAGPSSSSNTLLDLSLQKFDKPMQPVITFPPTMFGKVSRSFQKRWYENFPGWNTPSI